MKDKTKEGEGFTKGEIYLNYLTSWLEDMEAKNQWLY